MRDRRRTGAAVPRRRGLPGDPLEPALHPRRDGGRGRRCRRRPKNGNGAALGGTLFEPDHDEPLVVMVTSASPGEGKTTTTANLAAVFAEAGSSVLVVNCDFRRPTIHQYFGVDDEPRRVHETTIPGVKIVTNVLADPGSNPAQVVAAQRQVVAAARGRFDVILLDTAPLLTANDAVELVGSADCSCSSPAWA